MKATKEINTITINALKNSNINKDTNFLSINLITPNTWDKFLPHLYLLQIGKNNKKIKNVIIVPYNDFSKDKKGKG